MLHDTEELEADIPPDALAVLADARDAYSDRDKAEAALDAALKLAPDNLALCVVAYKFFFYANRLDDALPHAEACLAVAGDALLRQAASLDPQDRIGAGRLADVVARGGIDEED